MKICVLCLGSGDSVTSSSIVLSPQAGSSGTNMLSAEWREYFDEEVKLLEFRKFHARDVVTYWPREVVDGPSRPRAPKLQKRTMTRVRRCSTRGWWGR